MDRCGRSGRLRPSASSDGGGLCLPVSASLGTVVCTLALCLGVSRAFPLIVAANRDEFYDRPSEAPRRRPGHPEIVAGLDLRAGGTWLGCREGGNPFVVAVLNRSRGWGQGPAAPGERSRGSLAFEALGLDCVDDVAGLLDAESAALYGAFNLVAADSKQALFLSNAHGLECKPLARGLSVLTNLAPDDPHCPRGAGARKDFEAALPELAAVVEAGQLVPPLARVLGNHQNSADPDDRNPLARLCVHTEAYGTRSSSVVAIGADAKVAYFHAEGPPCCTPFERIV